MNEQSQLRKHLHFSWRERLRYLMESRRLGNLGANVFLEKNVQFMRFPKNISIADDTIIKEGVRVCSCNESAIIKIGARTTVGYHTFIFASDSIMIGADCLIAPFVYVVDSNHGTRRDLKINQQKNATSPIVIKDDVWIGAKATILAGVTIGTGAIVASGALVNRSVEPYSIVGGMPAIKIGERQ